MGLGEILGVYRVRRCVDDLDIGVHRDFFVQTNLLSYEHQ